MQSQLRRSVLVSSLAALALLLAGTGGTQAGFVYTISQTGANVVTGTGSGSFDITGLTHVGNATNNTTGAVIIPNLGVLATQTGQAPLFSGPSGPTNFGSGFGHIASTTSGDFFGIEGGASPAIDAGPSASTSLLILPSTSYTSGTTLSATDTWAGTIASLGLTPGTYTWTWNTTPGVVGPNVPGTSDFFTVDVVAAVPEPASVIPLLTGALGLLAYGWRRRKQAT
jgi:hypothetical protein